MQPPEELLATIGHEREKHRWMFNRMQLVRLKSGGPEMQVIGKDVEVTWTKDAQLVGPYWCVWDDHRMNGKLFIGKFDGRTLEDYVPDEDDEEDDD